MTKEEAKIIVDLLKTSERYITAIVASHIRAVRELVDHLTQKE